MLSDIRLPRLIKRMEQACGGFPDLRTGKNRLYELVEVGMSALDEVLAPFLCYLINYVRFSALIEGASHD